MQDIKNKLINIEVVYIENSNNQFLKNFNIKLGTTALEAIKISKVLEEFNISINDELPIGIFSKKISLNTILKNGDRVEIYRKLLIDPKTSRKIRALKNKNE